jgi:hypothetical protein
MKIRGKIIDLYEREFTWDNTPFITVTLVINAIMDVMSHKKGEVFSLTLPASFEYVTTNYIKKGQDMNMDSFYIELKELYADSSKFDNFEVEVDYYINSKPAKNPEEKRYFTNLKINGVKKIGGYDNDFTPDYVEQNTKDMGEFPKQDESSDLPF